MNNPKPLIILSAGGTGGHVIPAAALAHALQAKDYAVEVITDARGMKFAGVFGDIPIHEIPAGTFSPKGFLPLLMGLCKSIVIMLKNRPACVVGFGGYPSFPGTFAAQILCIPNILHESNAIFGKANKALGLLATKISLSWPKSYGLSSRQKAKSIVIGNPIRADIAALADKPYPPIKDTLNILVMGGSLGATIFSEVIPKAISQLTDAQRKKLRITQQCREGDINAVKSAYADMSVKAKCATFIENVPDELKKCHLFIGRSGGTVFEITAAGRPAIFVPYPHHADQQQKINAEAISDQGGAWTIEEHIFTPDIVKDHITAFLNDPSTLINAAGKSKACGMPDAAAKLAALIEEIIESKHVR